MADVLTRGNSPETILAEFLRDRAGRTWSWGDNDCGLWLADWVSRLRGVPDPAADLRGRYGDEASCRALLGPVPYPVLVGRLARAVGMARTNEPAPGDIAIIDGPAGDGVPVGAIRTAGGWAIVSKGRGVRRVPDEEVRVIFAWGGLSWRTR